MPKKMKEIIACRITNKPIYNKINAYIFEKYKDKKQKWQNRRRK